METRALIPSSRARLSSEAVCRNLSEPLDGPGDAGGMTAEGRDEAEAITLGAHQEAIGNLSLDERRET